MAYYSSYLLRTDAAIEAFRSSHAGRIDRALQTVDRYIRSLPDGQWVDFTMQVPQKNIPYLIGAICCWIDSRQDMDITIDFLDEDASMIRKRDMTPEVSPHQKYLAKLDSLRNENTKKQ